MGVAQPAVERRVVAGLRGADAGVRCGERRLGRLEVGAVGQRLVVDRGRVDLGRRRRDVTRRREVVVRILADEARQAGPLEDDRVARGDHVELALRDAHLGLEHVAPGHHAELEQALDALQLLLGDDERGVGHLGQQLGAQQRVVLLLGGEHEVGATLGVVVLVGRDVVPRRLDRLECAPVDDRLAQAVVDDIGFVGEHLLAVHLDQEARVEALLVPHRSVEARQIALQRLLLASLGGLDVLAGRQDVVIALEGALDRLVHRDRAPQRRRLLGERGNRDGEGEECDQRSCASGPGRRTNHRHAGSPLHAAAPCRAGSCSTHEGPVRLRPPVVSP